MKRLFLTLSLLLCCFLGLSAQKKQAVSVLYVGGSPEIETIGIGTPPDPAVAATLQQAVGQRIRCPTTTT